MPQQKPNPSEALEQLHLPNDNAYTAGLPGYNRNFTRDGIIYALIAGDNDAMERQLDFSASLQGQEQIGDTGEEPGKIHHEYPGVKLKDDYFTTYSACETTALFLLGICAVDKRTGNTRLAEKYRENIGPAIEYIRSHTGEDGLFWEDPALADAEGFGTGVTYWKDSVLNSPDPPGFPVVYSLAHFMNAAAVRAIGELTGDESLQAEGEAMQTSGIEQLWQDDHFVTAIDADRKPVADHSTDSLDILSYLSPSVLDPEKARAIGDYSMVLATEYGFKGALTGKGIEDVYHTRYVWAFEQAMIHAAAKAHGLSDVQKIAARVQKIWRYGFPELIDPQEDFSPAGNPTQLWSVGAYEYFQSTNRSLLPYIQ